MKKKIQASGMMLSVLISVVSTLIFTMDVKAGETGNPRLFKEISVQTVTGKVLDEKGAPLVGVSVSEKGTTTGVMTDANGNYRIQASGDNAV